MHNKAENNEVLLDLIKNISVILLSGEVKQLEKSLHSAMELMALGSGVDRMYIWRNTIIDGKACYKQYYQWLKKDRKFNTLLSVTGKNYFEAIPEWDEIFYKGKELNGPITLLSKTQTEFLRLFEIKSILLIPIFLQNKFWGFASFDNCDVEKIFCDEEVIVLRSGCLLLANIIMNNANNAIIETRMRQQEIMSDISGSFISREAMDKLIVDALGRMGKFMNVCRVLTAKMDEEGSGSQIIHTWLASDEWRPKSANSRIKELVRQAFPNSIPETGFLTALCCNNIDNEYSGRYREFVELDIKSFIWAPIYVDGNLWGLLSIEDCFNERQWTDSDVQLVGTVSSAISGAVARDIIDKARTDAMEQAFRNSEAKGYFLANMSHEMRTPMNAIIGMTAIGKTSKDINKKDYAFEKIEDASTHLLGVINDVLDMSKIEANKLELSDVTFNFNRMLQKVLSVISFRIDEKQQNFTSLVDENIPQFLLGDDQRLSQVITNLLSNAAKFTPDKGSIKLCAKHAGFNDGVHTIQIEVSDTGIGISKEQQERLFNSFEQAESNTSRKFGGTGLGLAISKRIVELMNGSIWIDSEPGKGATFAFTIQAKEGVPKESPDEIAKKHGVDDFSSYHVLLAEDIEINREILTTLLEPTRLNIDCAVNGKEAVDKYKANPAKYNLIFMDIHMPEVDGYEASRQIREFENSPGFPVNNAMKFSESVNNAMKFAQQTSKQLSRHPQGVPIIAMTANVFREDIEKCLAAGMDDHLSKPLDMEDVMEKLRSYLTKTPS